MSHEDEVTWALRVGLVPGFIMVAVVMWILWRRDEDGVIRQKACVQLAREQFSAQGYDAYRRACSPVIQTEER